jgi:hypothetical protein
MTERNVSKIMFLAPISILAIMVLLSASSLGRGSFQPLTGGSDGSGPNLSPTKVTVTLLSLGCLKTTGSGEDNVYVVVEPWRSGVKLSHARMPGRWDRWDLNDDRGQRSVDNVALWSGDVPEGTPTVVWVRVMKGIESGVSFSIGDFRIFGPDTQEHVLGAFAAVLTNQNGKILIKWVSGENTQERPLTPTVGNRNYPDRKVKEFWVLGSGGKYLAYLRTNPVFE